MCVEYTYDAWGVCTITTDWSECGFAEINPYRYRGYYYDVDTGMYYLQSRYYDPVVGRFLNADEVLVVESMENIIYNNLFAYCNNCAPNYRDITGYFAISIAAGAVVSYKTVEAMLALTTFLILFLFNKNFRNAISQLVQLITRGAVDGVGYLSNVISEVVSKAKQGKKYKGKEVHHIVAQKDRRAASSRSILSKYKIGIESSYNKVSIRKTFHKHLHTNSYHTSVYLVLKSCRNRGRTKLDKKYYVIAGLVWIGVVLKTASKVV